MEATDTRSPWPVTLQVHWRPIRASQQVWTLESQVLLVGVRLNIMPKSTAQGYRRILILEDSPAVADSLGMILSKQGYDARVAHSAEEAIELIAVWQPDLAIVDAMLPGMNGIEFASVLKANYPACERVLVSGHPGAAELVEKGRKLGDTLSILAKPLDPAVILAIASGRQPGAAETADA